MKLPSRLSLAARAIAMAAAILAFVLPASQARAQADQYYSIQEVVDAGHGFFGATSGALASAVEKVFARHGMPNGYILGQEAGGAFIGGLRYGEGRLHTKNAGDHMVYWQGPSLGFDYGVEGNRTMMLVYNLPSVDFVYNRFFGVQGSAFAVGGLSVTALARQGVGIVPISTGIGARLGVNVGYLKMTRLPRVNPF